MPQTNNRLSARLAALAHTLRDALLQARQSDDAGALYGLIEAMPPGTTPEQFADIGAQIVCCGLFAARCYSAPNAVVDRTHLIDLPVTHPFLHALFSFIAAPDLDERIAGIVDQLLEMLNSVDSDILWRDGERNELIHFYEAFLAAYDPGVRGLRGVYYTPEPVVSYIVRGVDHLLRTAFDVPGGLADALASEDGAPETRRVHLYDPAMGTGAFLLGTLDHVKSNFKGDAEQGRDDATNRLLPCLSGCELLLVPFMVAHLALSLRLAEMGCDARAGAMPRLFLGNALENDFAAWEGEVRGAGCAGDTPIMAIVGNPPYAGHSANTGAWITGLLHGYDGKTSERTASYFEVDGKPLNERNSKWLNDDYVKFTRYAQWLIERAGRGILAFVTNHGYLDNPTFRGMRRSLMHSFDDIYVLDLHGNSKRNERTPDGAKDENIFDVQQGIAIGIFVKHKPRGDAGSSGAVVRHADLRGSREEKYRWLAAHDMSTTAWTRVVPTPPFYGFMPQNATLSAAYERGWHLVEIMPINSLGILTKRDALATGFREQELLQNIAIFTDPALADAECAVRFGLPLRDKDTWDITKARAALRDQANTSSIRPVVYRPMDTRYVFYDDALVARRNTRVMRHLEQPNRALVLGRQGAATGADDWDVLFAVSTLVDQNIFRRGGGTVFPLYVYPATDVPRRGGPRGRPPPAQPNLSPAFIATMSESLKMQFIPHGKGNLFTTFGPDDVFNYMYAVLHAPTYRARYADFLKIDFPRLPLPGADLFRALCPLGARLVALHLMEPCGDMMPAYPIAGSNLVERVRYEPSSGDHPSGRVYINAAQYFDSVLPQVWSYHIGGNQVCHKWLKDRKGRVLSDADIRYYRRIVAALAETVKLIEKIDAGYSLFIDNAV